MAASKGVRVAVLLPPLVLVLLAFFSFIAYVSWSLHQFIPIPPKIKTECASMKNDTFLREYLQNRTVLREESGNATEGRIGAKHMRGSAAPEPHLCWAIRKRWFMPGDVPDTREVHHPLYLFRIVSRDYEFFEESFNMMFSPIHFYCFPISTNASEEFEEKLRFLGKCMLNVIVPEGRFDETNASDTFRGHNACFNRMDGFEWKHVLVTQESEIPLQSIHFIADSMRRLGDASRVGNELMSEETTRILSDPEAPERNTSMDLVSNAACHWLHGKREPLALSRQFAPYFYDVVLNSTNSTNLEDCQLNVRAEGPCSSKKRDKNRNCVWGMENYQQALRSKSLFARADPRFDMGFVECVHEFVFTRTYDISSYKIRYGSH